MAAGEPAGRSTLPDIQEIATLRAQIWAQLDNTDPLAGLPPETEDLLVRLAESPLELKRLERDVRIELEAKGRGTDAKKFSLSTYKAEAERRAKLSRAEANREKAMAARNAETDPDSGEVIQLERAADVGSNVTSRSGFLRAVGTLELHRPKRIWYDDFYQREMADWDGSSEREVTSPQDIDEMWRLRCHAWLHHMDAQLTGTETTNTRNAIRYVADQCHKNAAKDAITGWKWDGTARLKHWLARVFAVEQNVYHERVGINFFVSAAARIMEPGCKVDTMMVLMGEEGIGKSTALSIIGGDWYASISTSLSRKPEDFKTSLHGKAIIEIAEMESFTKAESTQLKDILSTSVDRYRKVWGQDVRDYPRTCVMVSTTNDMRWHNETTGYRRFWPVDCVGWPQADGKMKIDQEWLRQNVVQLWAEAVALYKNGASWHGDEIVEEQKIRVAEHSGEDPWEEVIESWLEGIEERSYTGPGCGIIPDAGDPSYDYAAHERWGTLITTQRVTHLSLQLPNSSVTKATSNRVARCMRRLGWEQKSCRDDAGIFRRSWVRKDIEPKKPINSET